MLEHDSYWARALSRRLSRRVALKAGAIAALGAASLALVGCEGGGKTGPAGTSTPQAGQPKYGSTLVQGRAVDPVGLDPHTDLASMDIFVKMYSNLYFLTPGRQAQMNLAESMEMPDRQTFIFALRQGAKFHDIDPVNGREITSEDVRYSFTRRGTDILSIDKRFWTLIQRGMETPDPYTFKVTLGQPFVPAFIEMGNPTWCVVPQEAVKRFDTLKQNAIGSGPYMLQRFVRAESVEMIKNPNFFLPGRPYLDGYKYVVIPSNDTLLAAFKSGQHDVSGAGLDALRVKDLQANKDVTVFKTPNFFYPVLVLNLNRPPFKDIKVREAIDLAIDRQELIDKIAFGEGNFNGPIQWGHTFWALPQDELRAFFRHDADRARQLLAEAGHEGGFSVTLKTANVSGFWADTVTLIAQQLGRVGINVDLQFMELGTWLATVAFPGNFDMGFAVQLPYDEPDRPLTFYHSLGVTGGGNTAGVLTKDIDQLIEKQRVTFDENERQKIIQDAQRLIIQQHGPHMPLFSSYMYAAFWNRVKGWWPPDEAGTYANIFNWDLWLDKA
ncbi:MAG: ABC transporter substrate-binding protein [Chloroflexota bacterium]|nr:ABC transporter substrate-binding protein [Chloroflexota bacterium]